MPLTDPNSHLSSSGGQANGTLLVSASPGSQDPELSCIPFSSHLDLSFLMFRILADATLAVPLCGTRWVPGSLQGSLSINGSRNRDGWEEA